MQKRQNIGYRGLNIMSGCIYYPTIWLEDQEDYSLNVNYDLRLYLEKEPLEFVEDNSIFTLDINEDTLNELERLAFSENEKKLIKRIRETEAEYINIEPHTYFVSD